MNQLIFNVNDSWLTESVSLIQFVLNMYTIEIHGGNPRGI